MSFVTVFLICIGGIAGCATLVFAVETVVALCSRKEKLLRRVTAAPIAIDRGSREVPAKKAA